MDMLQEQGSGIAAERSVGAGPEPLRRNLSSENMG